MGHWEAANKEKATRSHRRSRLLESAPRLRVRALRRPPRARALPCEGLHRCGHSVRWGRRICICASPEGRQAAGFQSDVGLRRDDEGAPGPSALATAGLELRGAHGAFFVSNLHRATTYTQKRIMSSCTLQHVPPSTHDALLDRRLHTSAASQQAHIACWRLQCM